MKLPFVFLCEIIDNFVTTWNVFKGFEKRILNFFRNLFVFSCLMY